MDVGALCVEGALSLRKAAIALSGIVANLVTHGLDSPSRPLLLASGATLVVSRAGLDAQLVTRARLQLATK